VHPGAQLVALDFSPLMLQRLRERFTRALSLILRHSLDDPLPALGAFVPWCRLRDSPCHDRQALYGNRTLRIREVSSATWSVASPALTACVSSAELGISPEDECPTAGRRDPADMVGELGFENVDCTWKWMELALLVGTKPPPE
jgi:hypothetical protein